MWFGTDTTVNLLIVLVAFDSSGIITPALDAGALFGHVFGQILFLFISITVGFVAMVGAAAFLDGVSPMTVSLVAATMLEIRMNVMPVVVAILNSKWVSNAISE